MPPASLSTFEVMIPGPATARKVRRPFHRILKPELLMPQRLSSNDQLSPVSASPGIGSKSPGARIPPIGASLSGVDQVLQGDDAFKMVHLVHHRKDHELVFAEKVGHLVDVFLRPHLHQVLIHEI
jgi:hypothetical protein